MDGISPNADAVGLEIELFDADENRLIGLGDNMRPVQLPFSDSVQNGDQFSATIQVHYESLRRLQGNPDSNVIPVRAQIRVINAALQVSEPLAGVLVLPPTSPVVNSAIPLEALRVAQMWTNVSILTLTTTRPLSV